MRVAGLMLMAAVLSLRLGGPAAAAPFTPDQRADIVGILRDALVRDPSILREALEALQADETRQAASAATGAIASHRAALLDDSKDPVEGNPAGRVAVVEFFDPRCPYCRQMLPVFTALLAAEPDVRLILKDIPILGPASVLESRALLAAQRQGGYARLLPTVMAMPGTPTVAGLRMEAERLGLDGARLERDMNDPAIGARLDANVKLATALAIEGTPALVVGDRLIPGAVGLKELREAVAAARAGR